MYLSPTTHGDRIRRCDAGRFVMYETTYASATSLPPHYHEVAALLFSTRGSFAENVRRRTFECNAFDVIVRPAGEVHTNRYGAGGATCVVVSVANDVMAGGAQRLFSEPSELPRTIVVPIAHRVSRELIVADDVSSLVVEGLLLEMIGAASRPVTCKHPPSWLANARDFIHEHAAERVTLHDIAGAASVHAASIVRAFRAHLSCSPGEYVRRVRIENAKGELTSTDRPVGDIALDAGFYDQSHFTNAFRRATGMTPREWRSAFRRSVTPSGSEGPVRAGGALN
jgi:AraC family transcriptional regulator